MNDLNKPEYRAFVQKIIDNIKKNGFPEKKVAFDIEKLYESAATKDINFNKVLQTLDEIEIGHTKTPEKIIFYPKDKDKDKDKEEQEQPPSMPGFDASMLKNIDPVMFQNMDMSMFQNMDMSKMKGMNLGSIMKMASQMMKNLSPEQLDSIKGMYDNMSDEDKASMIDKAKNMGLLNKDKDKDKDKNKDKND